MNFGHATYFAFILCLISTVVFLDLILKTRAYTSKNMWRSVGIIVLLTVIFDNLIVGLDIVRYDPNLISGIRIGYAPIEDFSYSLVIPYLVAIISSLYDRHTS